MDINYYKNLGIYNNNQLQQIELGIDFGLQQEQINVFANPNFNHLQMSQIRYGIFHDIDFNIYADKKFNSEQMCELRHGLEKGIDVKTYANPNYDVSLMYKFYLLLKNTREEFVNDQVNLLIMES